MDQPSLPSPNEPDGVLTINVGSSSIKFAFFNTGDASPERTLSGRVGRIGEPGTNLSFKTTAGPTDSQAFPSGGGQAEATRGLLDWLAARAEFRTVAVVAHRLVHGGPKHREPQRVTPELLADLDRLAPLAPEHLPAGLGVIRAMGARFPGLSQIACFDTAFHAGMPRVATLLAIPRRFEAMGIRRYGFHGLSYTFLLEELRRLDGESASRGRVILAHLGNGASMAAVRDGACIDTSMGFTPASGLPMSARSGDLDPGVFPYLARNAGMSADEFDAMVNHESGLRGISETSSDVRDLLACETSDPRAAEAVALFCYQTRKWVGAFAAALGGLDTLVFAGGIGENQPAIRTRICDGLGFLGVRLDPALNGNNSPRISPPDARVTVRVIPTDEEIVLARAARAFAPI